MERNIKIIKPSAPRLPSKKKVAAYARVSSGKDAMLHSLSAQISYYSDLIQRHPGWDYAGVYADEALSGTKDSRAEFQRMLGDCRVGKIDMVITKSISRFARNTVTMLEAVRELRSLNIDVFFEKENIHSLSGDGELMLTILASFAQEESRSVSENCKWRIRKQFQAGELANLRFMYGYRISKGRIEIDPEQAAIVRMVFDDYIGGMGCDLIAKKLRHMGVDSIQGGTWSADRVAALIKNEKYAGNALLQKKYVADHLTKTLVWNHGVLPKYFAENTHPPIIDGDTFRTAQAVMEERKRINRAGKATTVRYPFSGKIICTQCGKSYIRITRRGRVYWNCSTYLQFGKDTCHAKKIPEDILLAMTVDVMGLSEFDETIFQRLVEEIQIPEFNKIVYIFSDGSMVERTWQDKSRRDSWGEEAKQRARMKEIQRRESLC